MNRRGVAIPTAMIPILALVLAGIVLFSYVSFKGGLNENSEEISTLIVDLDFKERLVGIFFEKMVEEALVKAESFTSKTYKNNIKDSLKSVAEIRRNPDLGNLYFILIDQNPENFILSEASGIYTLTLRGVFVKSESGKNEMKKTFDLEIKFDKDKVIQRN